MDYPKKYVMWVEEIDNDNEIIHAVGHEVLANDTKSGTKYVNQFDFDWLKIFLGENGFKEMSQVGRIFYFYEGERYRFDLPFYEPLSEEDKKKAQEWAEEMFKNIEEK